MELQSRTAVVQRGSFVAELCQVSTFDFSRATFEPRADFLFCFCTVYHGRTSKLEF